MKPDFFDQIKNAKYPYIIAELGANHNGDMDIAKSLIRAAKECGSDCVKFQSWTPASLIAKEEYERNTKYNDSPKKHFGSLREMVEAYFLKEDQHYDLKEYCASLQIDFSSSPFSNEEIDLLIKLDVPFIKIASMDINNLSLLEYAAQTGKPIVLSTGMADLSEIDIAVRTIEKQNNFQIILLHCIAIYPPKFEDINLNNITMLKQTFGYPVGFSDHSFGIHIPLAAITLGACIIEKHFTIDKNMHGWDHEISADPNELKQIVQFGKEIVNSLGGYKRIVSADEFSKRAKFRRSIVISRDMKKGDILTTDDLLFKRPGTGIPPNEAKYVIGRKLAHDIDFDKVLNWSDFKK
ncbi:MAG: N-acetylneuraminate synthase family protein [Bacteroidia bacterium]|nr:N-acetylneuraminate synthase family protein [Bacteroidia bacterium]